MSRIGRLPIQVPAGVEVSTDKTVRVKGPKGQLECKIADGVGFEREGVELRVVRSSDSRTHRANHGLMRALVNNMVTGVTKGFERKLDIIGVGYKAENKGSKVIFNLGYSHTIDYQPPAGVSVAIEKNVKVIVTGIDKQAVGQVAAVIRGFRPPDSYKGKGVRYEGEVIRLKAGKSAKK